jgi:hypothetical protein
MRVLMENMAHRGGRQPHHQPVLDSSYTDFLAMHPPIFVEECDPLELDNRLRITEFKFELLHYSEFQKTIRDQQLCVSASVWCVNFTATLHDSYQLSWAEFRQAFHGQL